VSRHGWGRLTSQGCRAVIATEAFAPQQGRDLGPLIHALRRNGGTLTSEQWVSEPDSKMAGLRLPDDEQAAKCRAAIQQWQSGWLQLVGGGLFSVLPLPMWPYEPEQSVRHYAFLALYAFLQLPLLIVLTRRAATGAGFAPPPTPRRVPDDSPRLLQHRLPVAPHAMRDRATPRTGCPGERRETAPRPCDRAPARPDPWTGSGSSPSRPAR
jgi:hypothetical protein